MIHTVLDRGIRVGYALFNSGYALLRFIYRNCKLIRYRAFSLFCAHFNIVCSVIKVRINGISFLITDEIQMCAIGFEVRLYLILTNRIIIQ